MINCDGMGGSYAKNTSLSSRSASIVSQSLSTCRFKHSQIMVSGFLEKIGVDYFDSIARGVRWIVIAD